MKILRQLTYILLATLPMVSFAGVVIVHPSNGAALDSSAIKKVFLGKSKSFPDGAQAVPLDLEGGDVREQFINSMLGKSESQLKAYWSKLIFTGKGQAPKSVASEAEAVKLVSQNPNLIAYVSDGAVNDSVKVAAKF
ncbi:phosphate ABC transporter substrate-binding protein [Thalassotalea ganghwensis]